MLVLVYSGHTTPSPALMAKPSSCRQANCLTLKKIGNSVFGGQCMRQVGTTGSPTSTSTRVRMSMQVTVCLGSFTMRLRTFALTLSTPLSMRAIGCWATGPLAKSLTSWLMLHSSTRTATRLRTLYLLFNSWLTSMPRMDLRMLLLLTGSFLSS